MKLLTILAALATLALFGTTAQAQQTQPHACAAEIEDSLSHGASVVFQGSNRGGPVIGLANHANKRVVFYSVGFLGSQKGKCELRLGVNWQENVAPDLTFNPELAGDNDHSCGLGYLLPKNADGQKPKARFIVSTMNPVTGQPVNEEFVLFADTAGNWTLQELISVDYATKKPYSCKELHGTDAVFTAAGVPV